MNEVLGTSAGNAVEIKEAVQYLRNEARDPRLDAVVMGLCAEMLIVGGLEVDRDRAHAKCEQAVASGQAAEIFGRMTAALGGPTDFVENCESYLAEAPVVREVFARGVITKVHTRSVGEAIVELGGGRHTVGEKLDLSVGFTDIACVGTRLDGSRPFVVIHAANEADAEIAEKNLLKAFEIGDSEPAPRPVVHEILTG